jgi:hypothetical protein
MNRAQRRAESAQRQPHAHSARYFSPVVGGNGNLRNTSLKIHPDLLTKGYVIDIGHINWDDSLEEITSTSPAAVEIVEELKRLNEKMDQFIQRVSAVEAAVASSIYITSEPDITTTIPDEDAAQMIKEFFEAHDGEDFYPDDIANALSLPMEQVVRLCETLANEEKIARRS